MCACAVRCFHCSSPLQTGKCFYLFSSRSPALVCSSTTLGARKKNHTSPHARRLSAPLLSAFFEPWAEALQRNGKAQITIKEKQVEKRQFYMRPGIFFLLQRVCERNLVDVPERRHYEKVNIRGKEEKGNRSLHFFQKENSLHFSPFPVYFCFSFII
uniref:Uncharacterized protein TCIL3000_11_9710 n=1 Tax=Trypanosoma congolense (strain IL3000) TaxID=1068625 RepID=G0V1I3_TRYCI|nr:unnamed protein product [Trypanosoma congolense IL3000]